MNDFETAAHAATCGISRVMPFWGDQDAEQIEAEITKHYADLAETFGLLCELARATKLFVMAHDNLETEKALNRSNYNTDIEDIAYIGKAVAGTELRNLLANPRIAALLAEKKG